MSSTSASVDESKVHEGKAIDPAYIEKLGAFEEDGGIHDRPAMERKLLWKLDLRFSILIIIYILNYIDRNNLSAARLKGLETDLKLKGNEYPTLLSLLYVGYIIMQIPSNMIVQYTGRPSIYLPICMAVWGTISCLTGITHNFTGALLTRFFLGFIEAAFFPGAIFLLSKWYTRKELGLRTAVLYCGSLISSAFGPLMAAGILSRMEGVRGIRAWRWLFYIEGALTIFFAFVAFFVLPDFPENTRGFTDAERTLAQLRMAEDYGEKDLDNMTPIQGLKAAVTDYKVWVMAISLTSMVISLSFNQFFPTLTKSLGFSSTISLLLAAPPFAFATLCAFLNARHSDKKQERAYHIVAPLCIGIIGFIIAMATKKIAPRYFALFLMASSYSGFVVFYAWISNSFPRPAMKRAVAIAFINAFSQLGNVTGAYVFPKTWGPTYHKSYGICIACFVFCIGGVFVHRWSLARLNRQLESQDNNGGVDPANLGKPSIAVPRGFRYVL
ncbi:MFS transporter, ACS family, pantothenate transporter, partial [Phenoliferia sp. Uapishka_3]